MSSDTEKTILERLMELKDLYESGLITKEEMEVKKRQILETDNPSADNPNGGIKNELNGESPNQAEDGYRPGKFCSSTPNVEEEEQLESNNEHGGEQKKETNHKLDKDLKLILRLSLIVAAVVAAIVVSSIISTPTDYNKKVEKAVEKYQSEFGNVLSTSGIGKSTEENHYVIYERGGTIFYDGLDKGATVKEIMPKEGGFIFKQVLLDFKDGKPKRTYKLLNDGKKSNIKLGVKESKGGLITKRTEAKNNVLNGYKSICIMDVVSDVENDGARVATTYFYSLSNPDTVYVFRGNLTHTEDESCCKQDFSFLDVLGGKEDGLWSPFSYNDYHFTMGIKFPNSDAGLLGLDDYIYIDEEGFPMDIIRDKIYCSEKDGYLLLPSVWFEKGKMGVVFDCLEQDMKQKHREEETEANTFTLTDLCNIFYESSKKFNGESFKERFPTGKELYLSTTAESIKYSSESGYKYVIKATKGLGLEVEANIYTNDESFVNLDYPVIINAKVVYDRTYTEKKSLYVPATRIFDFYDAELKAWGYE